MNILAKTKGSDIMRKIYYKGHEYVGNACFQCNGHEISFYHANEGYVAICNNCNAWEWLEDAIDCVSFLKQIN